MGYTTTQINKELTIGVTVHDKTPELRQKEVGSGNLRHKVKTRFRMIYHQYSINEPAKGGMVEFELQ